MDNVYPSVKSADLYECAYYFSCGCTVKTVEMVLENKKDLCFLHMTGENILTLQQEYFKSTATVNVFDFRRSYVRLMNIVAVAKKQTRQQGRFSAVHGKIDTNPSVDVGGDS